MQPLSFFFRGLFVRKTEQMWKIGCVSDHGLESRPVKLQGTTNYTKYNEQEDSTEYTN